MPRVVIFLCDDQTQGECFARRLFGTQESYGLKVCKGDFCLLYNYSEGQKQIYGVWRATTDGGSYEPLAWNRRYRYQVRIEDVGRTTNVAKNHIRVLDDFENIGRIYEGVQADELLQYFPQAVESNSAKQTPPSERVVGRSPPTENRTQQTDPDYLLLPPKFFCEDSDRVRSQGEKIIDDCLFRFGVRHIYEPKITIKGGRLLPDFVVFARNGDPVYIEYWGKLDDADYNQRRKDKTRLYNENNLALIQIIPDDLRVIEFVLGKELEKWNVAFKKPKSGFIHFISQLLRRIFSIFRGPR